MNWYKFKVKLVSWAVRVVLCVLSAYVFMQMLVIKIGHAYPMSMRWLAENEWIIRSSVLLLTAALWLCYFRGVRVFRSRHRYAHKT